MNLAVIGSGGREHAICYKLKQSSKVKNLICTPSNAGTQSIAKNINGDILNFTSVAKNLFDARKKALINLNKLKN